MAEVREQRSQVRKRRGKQQTPNAQCPMTESKGRSEGSKASSLSCDQLDFDLLAQRAGSTIESSESDRSILRIKQSMNSGPGRSHFCRQSAFAQVLFVHQVVHFQGHGPLERCGLNLFDHSLFSEEIPEAAAAMFVSRLNYMTVSFLIRLSKRDLQLESWKLGDRSREQRAGSREQRAESGGAGEVT